MRTGRATRIGSTLLLLLVALAAMAASLRPVRLPPAIPEAYCELRSDGHREIKTYAPVSRVQQSVRDARTAALYAINRRAFARAAFAWVLALVILAWHWSTRGRDRAWCAARLTRDGVLTLDDGTALSVDPALLAKVAAGEVLVTLENWSRVDVPSRQGLAVVSAVIPGTLARHERSLRRGRIGTLAAVVTLALVALTSLAVARLRALDLARRPIPLEVVPPPVGKAVAGAQPSAIRRLEMAYGHACAVLRDETVWCWGAPLLIGADTARPSRVPGLNDVTQVALGESHACALERDGSVWCWGDDRHAQLGTEPNAGSQVALSSPRRVLGLPKARSIGGARFQTFALSEDHNVWWWGSRADFAGEVDIQTIRPTVVQGLSNVLEIATGPSMVLARLDDGNLLWWGYSGFDRMNQVWADQPLRFWLTGRRAADASRSAIRTADCGNGLGGIFVDRWPAVIGPPLVRIEYRWNAAFVWTSEGTGFRKSNGPGGVSCWEPVTELRQSRAEQPLGVGGYWACRVLPDDSLECNERYGVPEAHMVVVSDAAASWKSHIVQLVVGEREFGAVLADGTVWTWSNDPAKLHHVGGSRYEFHPVAVPW